MTPPAITHVAVPPTVGRIVHMHIEDVTRFEHGPFAAIVTAVDARGIWVKPQFPPGTPAGLSACPDYYLSHREGEPLALIGGGGVIWKWPPKV